jgi:hypothetical protein
VPDIMQQDSYDHGPGFLLGDVVPFGADDLNGQAHQVHGPYGMLKTGMVGPGIHKESEAQLPDPAQSLKEGVFDQVKNHIIRDFYEAIDRIIDDFQFVCGDMFPHLGHLWHKIILLLP